MAEEDKMLIVPPKLEQKGPLKKTLRTQLPIVL